MEEKQEEWIFNLLSNIAIKVNGEQKASILEKLTALLRVADIGVIELTAEDGSAVGFRSDSIVAWTKVVNQDVAARAVPGLVRAG